MEHHAWEIQRLPGSAVRTEIRQPNNRMWPYSFIWLRQVLFIGITDGAMWTGSAVATDKCGQGLAASPSGPLAPGRGALWICWPAPADLGARGA